MGSVPVGVEGVCDLKFHGLALTGRWPVTPSPSYLRPGLIITAEWAGSAAEAELSI